MLFPKSIALTPVSTKIEKNFSYGANYIVNIRHRFCTCNADHLGLLINTESVEKETMMSQLLFVLFISVRVRGVKIDGGAQMVDVLTTAALKILNFT